MPAPPTNMSNALQHEQQGPHHHNNTHSHSLPDCISQGGTIAEWQHNTYNQNTHVRVHMPDGSDKFFPNVKQDHLQLYLNTKPTILDSHETYYDSSATMSRDVSPSADEDDDSDDEMQDTSSDHPSNQPLFLNFTSDLAPQHMSKKKSKEKKQLQYRVNGVNILNRNSLDMQTAMERLKRRRENHNNVERKRRNNINNTIYEISLLMPTAYRSGSKPNKGSILRRAVEYIKHQQQPSSETYDSNDAATTVSSVSSSSSTTNSFKSNASPSHADHMTSQVKTGRQIPMEPASPLILPPPSTVLRSLDLTTRLKVESVAVMQQPSNPNSPRKRNSQDNIVLPPISSELAKEFALPPPRTTSPLHISNVTPPLLPFNFAPPNSTIMTSSSASSSTTSLVHVPSPSNPYYMQQTTTTSQHHASSELTHSTSAPIVGTPVNLPPLVLGLGPRNNGNATILNNSVNLGESTTHHHLHHQHHTQPGHNSHQHNIHPIGSPSPSSPPLSSSNTTSTATQQHSSHHSQQPPQFAQQPITFIFERFCSNVSNGPPSMHSSLSSSQMGIRPVQHPQLQTQPPIQQHTPPQYSYRTPIDSPTSIHTHEDSRSEEDYGDNMMIDSASRCEDYDHIITPLESLKKLLMQFPAMSPARLNTILPVLLDNDIDDPEILLLIENEKFLRDLRGKNGSEISLGNCLLLWHGIQEYQRHNASNTTVHTPKSYSSASSAYSPPPLNIRSDHLMSLPRSKRQKLELGDKDDGASSTRIKAPKLSMSTIEEVHSRVNCVLNVVKIENDKRKQISLSQNPSAQPALKFEDFVAELKRAHKIPVAFGTLRDMRFAYILKKLHEAKYKELLSSNRGNVTEFYRTCQEVCEEMFKEDDLEGALPWLELKSKLYYKQ
ncbi:1817_t:CDS:2 [Ambispora gerdemannii]|uniref:1817_t:CDS:1 n=1 Tax=Ambispora gerdemannii TaxID=144530 RepID=A0A9N8WFJ9_9GLOM|nr:1817_t:CDS:2 [Ambispora gerdemannii]